MESFFVCLGVVVFVRYCKRLASVIEWMIVVTRMPMAGSKRKKVDK
jgi:hypothetical protein